MEGKHKFYPYPCQQQNPSPSQREKYGKEIQTFDTERTKMRTLTIIESLKTIFTTQLMT